MKIWHWFRFDRRGKTEMKQLRIKKIAMSSGFSLESSRDSVSMDKKRLHRACAAWRRRPTSDRVFEDLDWLLAFLRSGQGGCRW